jgi:hypothetical protein
MYPFKLFYMITGALKSMTNNINMKGTLKKNDASTRVLVGKNDWNSGPLGSTC